MFIQTEDTPNPNTMKFLPGETLLKNGTKNYTSAKAAKSSPLAHKIFETPGVTGVFIGENFISISKDQDTYWEAIKPLILDTLILHLTTKQPIIVEEVSVSNKAAPSPGDSPENLELIKQIKDIIETRVRPSVAMDGGDIIFNKFDESGIVYLEMHGACSGCPSSAVTLKMGIENLLKYYVPEVTAVQQVDENGIPIEMLPVYE